MLRIHVSMNFTHEPLKRTPVSLVLDTDPTHPIEGSTDRMGIAEFDIPPASGKIVISGGTRYHGRLEGDIEIGLWSLTDSDAVDERGAPGVGGGSTAYPNMKTRKLKVNGHEVVTDSEGYLVDLADWSEDFVRAEAEYEGLELNSQHWEIIRFLRSHYEKHMVQANVREIIKHFRKVWGPEQGSNRYLHDLFPRGGPQKQGNRLAGLLRVKGEH
ncbi:MAG: TusE/DsrC/DsvC family sulfur relay protein [Gammaproteobacteria bacterium]|nr:TusE/DsrC/DsvC family sulfur relay protein [Gammaproteobacteria bacterium]